MKSLKATIQIGKNGLTSGIIQAIKNSFKTRENVKIQLLKSTGHTKEKTQEIAEEIIQELGNKYTYKILGFSIFFKKWRKERG
jgi:RNA-binding protein YhbY